MPLQKKDRKRETFTLLSTVKASPRGVITGRQEPSARSAAANAVPAPSQYQSLRDWSNTRDGRGPRIGARSVGPIGRGMNLEPDSMLGSTLRSKNLGVPWYDPQPGMGEYNHRKPAAVMCGNHGKAPVPGTEADTSTTPGPQSYASTYDTLGGHANAVKADAHKGSMAGTFGSRHDAKDDNGVPGPGAYEEDYNKTMSPYARDPKDPRKVRRPSSMSGLTYNKGKTMTGRWREPKLAEATPGPGEYTPMLPFIGGSSARAPTLKGRLPHPFVDSLADHECAKGTTSHQTRGNQHCRFKAKYHPN